jgi:chromosome segregation ATPase
MSNMAHEAGPGSAPQPLGTLLVGNGLLSQEQLAAALAEQQQTGRQLGEIVVANGWVSGPLVAQALATQRGGLTKTEYGYATGFPTADEAATPAAPVAPPPVTIEVPTRPALRLATPPPVSSDSELRAQVAATDPIVPLVPPPAVEPPAPAPAAEQVLPAPAADAEPQPAAQHPEIEALRERIAELELIADAAATNTETARAQAASAQADLQAAQTETEAMRERLTALEQRSGAGEADTLRARVTELDTAVSEAKASEAEALEQLQAAQAEAEALRERLTTIEAQAADSGEADALRARVTELESTISEAKGREAEALEQLHSAAAERGELEAARVEADALRRRLGDLEAQMEQAADSGEADALRARVAELEEQAGQSASADARVNEATAREVHALEQLGAATAERDDLRRRVTDLDQELRSATARRDLLAEEAQATKDRVTELEAVAAGLRAELETRAHVTESSETSDAMQSRLAQLEHRLEGAHHQLSALQGGSELLADVERRLAAALSEQAATGAKMRMLERELAERTRAYVEVADELARVHGGGTTAEADTQPPARHLVFATIGTAYEIVELDGPPPEPGDTVELESGRHLVVRVGSSPLAGSRLRCAYTIPA